MNINYHTMKKLLMLSLLAAFLPLTAFGQGLPKTVKEVRERYAQAHQEIADMDLEEHMVCRLISTSQRNMPAIGIQKETLTAYFNNQDRDEDWYPIFRLFFLTRKYNVSARNFYEEYLFDAQTGRLIFVFLQGDNYFSESKDETRYYFGEEGLISENIKGERIAEADSILRSAEALRTAAITLISRTQSSTSPL